MQASCIAGVFDEFRQVCDPVNARHRNAATRSDYRDLSRNVSELKPNTPCVFGGESFSDGYHPGESIGAPAPCASKMVARAVFEPRSRNSVAILSPSPVEIPLRSCSQRRYEQQRVQEILSHPQNLRDDGRADVGPKQDRRTRQNSDAARCGKVRHRNGDGSRTLHA